MARTNEFRRSGRGGRRVSPVEGAELKGVRWHMWGCSVISSLLFGCPPLPQQRLPVLHTQTPPLVGE